MSVDLNGDVGISLAALRKRATRLPDPPTTAGIPPVPVRRSDLVALVDAVEAAELHMRGQDEPADLRAALARFDFGATA